MTVNHIELNYPTLEQINTENGRLYVTPEGYKFPSITTVIGKTSDDSWVDEWKAKVGEDEANKTSKRATLRGQALHSLCEDYLNNKPSEPSMFDIEQFNQFKKALVNIDNVYAIEKRLYSVKFRTAGTVDLVAEFHKQITVLDWKTSNKEKKVEEIPGYFVQGAFYAFCMYEMFKIKIPKITIVMAVDGAREPLVFQENVVNWMPSFIELRKRFKELEGY